MPRTQPIRVREEDNENENDYKTVSYGCLLTCETQEVPNSYTSQRVRFSAALKTLGTRPLEILLRYSARVGVILPEQPFPSSRNAADA